jgi:Flp pilus assembly protein TadG
MLSPLIRRPGRNAELRSRERGVTMALVALSMAVIICMAALSIDIGTLYQAKAEAQRAADAAALTAARVISISGITTDPGNATNSWQSACGGATSTATQAAVSMAQQNLIGGVAAGTVNVSFGAGPGGGLNGSCVSIANFGVNPIVTVSVQRTNLPVFFARIFSLFGSAYTGSTVSATATAEAFNPSGSFVLGEVPVNPRCVKPWFVPNEDPGNKVGCTGTGCQTFVTATTGTITNPGTLSGNKGVIGETFNLLPDCETNHGGRCHLLTTNPGPYPVAMPPSTLQYVPGEAPGTSVAIAANGTINGCSQIQNATYWNAVAGCDQSTTYACGNLLANNVDLADNPGLPGNDSVDAVQCLINESTSGVGNGQDYLAPGPSTGPYTYPFQILAGGNSALVSTGVAGGSQISSSPSIVSLPIYDSVAVSSLNKIGTTPVTVIGFLQVFINSADSATGNINVTVMNVAGCGNSFGGPPVALGTSPVPIRLITPP